MAALESNQEFDEAPVGVIPSEEGIQKSQMLEVECGRVGPSTKEALMQETALVSGCTPWQYGPAVTGLAVSVP